MTMCLLWLIQMAHGTSEENGRLCALAAKPDPMGCVEHGPYTRVYGWATVGKICGNVPPTHQFQDPGFYMGNCLESTVGYDAWC